MTAIEQINTPVERRRVTSFDGTSIAYYVAGSGPCVWVIPPGLGTPLIAWKRVLEHFSDRLTMITWDQRGTYASGVPADLSRLRVADHVGDLEAVVAAAGVDRFVLGGWSLAVQTSLEYYAQNPQRVSALVLLNGAYEHILKTAIIPNMEGVFKPLVGVLGRVSGPLAPVIRRSFGLGPALLPRLGLVADSTPLLREVIRAFSAHDWPVYFRIMRAVSDHSAARYLDEVAVPTLIAAGEADRMTPLAIAEAMHRRIQGSELVRFPRGTHFTQLEFPDRMNQVIGEFLTRHALG